jgi:hypothetical protein
LNDSTQAGYLSPVSPPPDYDEQLEREISRWIRGVSGLPEGMVRPRWTPVQSSIPVEGSDWCAFGITRLLMDMYPAEVAVDDDKSAHWQQESLYVICCFYGPSGSGYATVFRDGIFLPQNNAELNRTGLSLASSADIIPAPELINNQWQRRYDVTVRLRRKTVREYGIKSLLSAPVQFFGD